MPSAQDVYQQYFDQSRTRWRSGVTATVRQIDSIYDKAGRDVTSRISRLLPTQPSARHLTMIQGALREARQQLAQETLDATLNGIRLSTSLGVQSAQQVAFKVLGNAFEAGGLASIYQAVNQRAVVAFATRTRFDGLRLSDRIWQQASKWQGYVQRATESAVATGLPARELAAALDPYLKAGTSAPSSLAVRRRLGIPSRISYQSLRVARTEMSMAFKEGTLLGHSKVPSYLGSQWELSAAHPFDDDCDDLSSGGPNNDGIYPAGDEPSQPHPNCMCTLSPIHEPLEQFTERVKDWVNDPSSEPALEEWHQNVAKPFFNGRPVPARSLGKVPVKVVSRARASSIPTPTSARQVEALQPVQTIDDVDEALARAVQADREVEAKRIAEELEQKRIQAEIDQVRETADLENRLVDLDREATKLGGRPVTRSVDEATAEHQAALKRAGQATTETTEKVAETFDLAGAGDWSLAEQIEQQQWVNASLRSRTNAIGADSPIVFTKNSILGNGGTGAGEVYGNTVVAYSPKWQVAAKAGSVPEELIYQQARAQYRMGLGPSTSDQQALVRYLQSANTAKVKAILGEGADRAEGFYGALVRRGITKPPTLAELKTWPDELVQAMRLVEDTAKQLGLKVGKGTATKYAKSLEAAAKKKAAEVAARAAKDAVKRQAESAKLFDGLEKYGKPGSGIDAADVKAFLADSKVKKAVYHRTTEQSVRAIQSGGIDPSVTSTYMYGKGFYTSTKPISGFGYAEVRVAIRSTNPFVSNGYDFYSKMDAFVRRFRAAHPGSRLDDGVAFSRQLLDEGYDSIRVKGATTGSHAQRNASIDYIVGLDARNLRWIR